MTSQPRLEDTLLAPFRLGDTLLQNRVVMASMTRGRASNAGLVPTGLHVEYYRQRASAGLIMTEATWISEQATGSINVPGLFSDEQVAAWRVVTDVVHGAGGRIYAQVGHSGAVSHPDFFDGQLPLAPSAVNPGLQSFTLHGFKDTVTPRAMTLADIEATIIDYGAAARNARRAGFDGVELHAATTYLLPQFLNSALNQRTDRYGGAPENRSRIVIEILEAMIAEWAGAKVGIKISPAASMGGFGPTQETVPTYDHLVERLNRLPLSHLQVVRAPRGGPTDSPVAAIADTIGYYRARYRGVLIANGGFDAATGAAAIAQERADLISFGAPFIGNPDLVRRFAEGFPTFPSDRATYYQGGREGYLDYPPLLSENASGS
jgi:N-ethylmaleimide reductase